MNNKEYSRQRKASDALRLVVLLSVLGVLTVFGILHQYSEGWRPSGVDALCPFGGVESLVTVLSAGKMLERIALSSFVLLGATIATAVLFRRSFCGVICPLGTLQELSVRLGKKLFRKKFLLPEKIDRIARYLKYPIFVGVVVFSVLLGELVFRPYDPWVAWQHLTSAELLSSLRAGLVVLILSLAGSLLFDRVFCKYLCPLGGFLGIIGKIGFFRIRRNPETCIDCNACSRVCPVNIPVATIPEVKSSECINCNLCVNSCPVENTLTIEGKKKGRITPRAMLGATVAIFAAVVITATLANGFEWSVKGIEERTLTSGNLNPDEIKGSDKFADVSRLSGIPKEEFVKQFGLTEAEFAGTLKDWAHKPGSTFDVQNVRDFVKERIKK